MPDVTVSQADLLADFTLDRVCGRHAAGESRLGDVGLALEALRVAEAERDQLRAEIEPARYVWGDQGCAGEDRKCDEYFTEDGALKPNVKWCSHVEHRIATFADVWARERLEALVEDIRDQARGGRLPDTAAELAERIDEELDAIAHAVAEEFGIDAYSTSQANAAVAALRAEREAWLKDPGRKELSESYQREFELREDNARLRRLLGERTDSHCHVVRDGDTVPCTARPGDPHVDEVGDGYVTVPLGKEGVDRG
jgi:hypothetical protein